MAVMSNVLDFKRLKNKTTVTGSHYTVIDYANVRVLLRARSLWLTVAESVCQFDEYCIQVDWADGSGDTDNNDSYSDSSSTPAQFQLQIAIIVASSTQINEKVISKHDY